MSRKAIGASLTKLFCKIPLTEKESAQLDRWCIKTKHYDARERWSNPDWVMRATFLNEEERKAAEPGLDRVWAKLENRMAAEKKL